MLSLGALLFVWGACWIWRLSKSGRLPLNAPTVFWSGKYCNPPEVKITCTGPYLAGEENPPYCYFELGKIFLPVFFVRWGRPPRWRRKGSHEVKMLEWFVKNLTIAFKHTLLESPEYLANTWRIFFITVFQNLMCLDRTALHKLFNSRSISW